MISKSQIIQKLETRLLPSESLEPDRLTDSYRFYENLTTTGSRKRVQRLLIASKDLFDVLLSKNGRATLLRSLAGRRPTFTSMDGEYAAAKKARQEPRTPDPRFDW